LIREISGSFAVAYSMSLICFYDFASSQDETVILGHAGFLDYFTATFEGRSAIVTLTANDDLPSL
jgi:hypothetical protein